jgi:hypothetical protein
MPLLGDVFQIGIGTLALSTWMALSFSPSHPLHLHVVEVSRSCDAQKECQLKFEKPCVLHAFTSQPPAAFEHSRLRPLVGPH